MANTIRHVVQAPERTARMTKLLVIDTETGGIDPDRHSLLSLAAVVWADGRIEGEIEIFVSEPDITVTARALEINRIDLVEHAQQAVAPAETLSRLLAFVADHFRAELAAGEQVVLAGHNVGFDVSFLRRLCRLAGSAYPAIFSHRTLDTASILRFLSLAGIVPPAAVASTEAFAFLGVRIPERLRHTALGDARATAELLTHLIGLVLPAGIAAAASAAA
jgi:DNA polymerase III subunit epsilon